jgi:hypothetical protein
LDPLRAPGIWLSAQRVIAASSSFASRMRGASIQVAPSN